MKKALTLTAVIATALLTGCQPGVSQAEFDSVKADVDALNIKVFGDPRAKCAAENILDNTAYPDDAASIMEAVEAARVPAAEGEEETLPSPAEWHKVNGEREGVVTTASGLQYKVIKSGPENGISPEGSQTVKVNYHGFFPNGDMFDSSYERGQPIEFRKNGVIPGWVEALGLMKPCDAWQLYIPGDLAYGPNGRGSIPPNATLLFNVQLLEVKDDK